MPSLNEAGVSHTAHTPAAVAASNAKVITGKITFWLGMPAARMAVISPSLDMRPSPISMPTSTPNGIVMGSKAGKARLNR